MRIGQEIIQALQRNPSRRLSQGNKWLVWSMNEWIVMELRNNTKHMLYAGRDLDKALDKLGG